MEDNGEIDLYYFDGSSFSLMPYIPYAWQKKNEEITIASAHSKNISVLGFLRRDNLFSSYVIEGNANSEIIIAVFDSFISSLPKTRKSFIVIDNAPTHTSYIFESMKSIWKEQNVHIFNISPYSPELNIIEILWKEIKYRWMPFEAYESYETLSKSLNDILKNVGKIFTIKFA